MKTAHWDVDDHICSDIYPVAEISVGNNIRWDRVRRADRCYVGVLIQKAISNDLPPLQYLTEAGYTAMAQMDVCYPKEDLSIFPQVDAIEEMIIAYPEAYYIHTRRSNLASHVASMAAWHGMLERLKDAGWLSRFEGQSNKFSDAQNGEIMIEAMSNITTSAFSRYPEVKFLEVLIEDPGAADAVASFLGLSKFP